MEKIKIGVKMTLRLVLFSLILFMVISCVESNPADSTSNNEDVDFINKWYLLRADIYNADFSQYIGEDFVASTIDECGYLLDVYEDSCIAYYRREYTFKYNNNYEIINDSIYTDNISFGMTYEIKNDTLIITGVDSAKDKGYIIKYSLYEDIAMPPTGWAELTDIEPDILTSFFLRFDYDQR